nr:MAG TPA: hypothetical protein [Caudoviricetes sp.]
MMCLPCKASRRRRERAGRQAGRKRCSSAILVSRDTEPSGSVWRSCAAAPP